MQWGCDHEHDAIQQYMVATGVQVEECGVATSPDGIIRLGNQEFEVKCPYKHRDSSIELACQDSAFCLNIDGH